MSQRSDRRTARSYSDTSAERSGHSENFPRNIVEGYVDVVSRLADAAEHVANVALDNSPYFGARTSGDAVRQAPETIRQAALAWNDGMIDVTQGIINSLDLRNWDRRRTTEARHAGDAAPASQGFSETELVETARRFIVRGRYRGATLEGLIGHLRPQTSLSDDQLKALIARHFLVDGDLVFSSRDEEAADSSDLPDSVEAHLRALNYTDLRRDVSLERLAPEAPRARLIAYHDNQPAVLVYWVTARKLTDVGTDEDARFQAKALSKTTSPRFIYLTDGKFNRYLSVEDNRVIASLPRAGEAA